MREFVVHMLDVHQRASRAGALASNEDICWPQIYYSLRCGHVHLAQDFARNSEHAALLSKVLEAFHEPNTRSRFHSDVKSCFNKAEKSGRPYERAVWNILGRCEPERDFHREVAVNIEDFLWVRLHMVPEEPKKRLHAFAALQRLISETYGEAHFQAESEPWKYFRILILTAQYEKAIDFLRGHDAILAVHFAIPLVHYGLLNYAKTINKPMRAFGGRGSASWGRGREESKCM